MHTDASGLRRTRPISHTRGTEAGGRAPCASQSSPAKSRTRTPHIAGQDPRRDVRSTRGSSEQNIGWIDGRLDGGEYVAGIWQREKRRASGCTREYASRDRRKAGYVSVVIDPSMTGSLTGQGQAVNKSRQCLPIIDRSRNHLTDDP